MDQRGGGDNELVQQHRGRSKEVLEILAKDGVDISKPRKVDIFFWCANRSTAQALAAELQARGYGDVIVGQSSTDQVWGAQAARVVPPAEVATDAFTADMIRLARSHRSEYDGWGVRH